MVITVSMREPFSDWSSISWEIWQHAINCKFLIKSKSSHYEVKEGVLTTYYRVMNRLLQKYAIYFIMAKKGNEIAHSVKPSTLSPLELAHELWLKRWRCSNFYDAHVLKKILVKWILLSIGSIMWQIQGSLKTAELQNLRITPHLCRKYKQPHNEWNSQPCTRATDESRIIFKQIVAERRLPRLDRQTTRRRRLDDYWAKEKVSQGYEWRRGFVVIRPHHNSCQHEFKRCPWPYSVL